MTGTALGLIAAGAAWYGSWAYWAATRIWVPLDVPISLAQGRTRTTEFRINFEGNYGIEVEGRPALGPGGQRCDAGWPPTTWTVAQRGQTVASGASADGSRPGGWFSVGAGTYTVDLEVKGDARCFHAASPRLRIAAVWHDRRKLTIA